MAYEASILADSISPQGHRITTALARYPRFVHAEHTRHRGFAFSVASSRALPPKALIEQVMTDPVLPVYWGKLAKGMGAKEELTGRQRDKAETRWLRARDAAVDSVQMLLDLGRHHDDDLWDDEDMGVGLSKELANRILEPWMWVTVVVTGTEAAWENFFWLRCHPDAQPEIRRAAELLEALYITSTPRTLRNGSWHMPFVREEDWTDADLLLHGEDPRSPAKRFEELNGIQELLKKVSAARCARTSYLTHDGRRALTEDVGLYGRLLEGADAEPEQPMHLSPLEHVATPVPESAYIDAEKAQRIASFAGMHHLVDLPHHMNKYGNLEGWLSLRHGIPGESGRGKRASQAETTP